MRLELHLFVRGINLKINIVEKDELIFYGLANKTSLNDNFLSYWENYYEYVSSDYHSPIGFSTHPNENGEFVYYTCVQDKPKNTEVFEKVTLPKGNYAIFELTGSVLKTIPKAWEFAQKNFVISNSPSIEVYSEGDRLGEDYRVDLWIPIEGMKTNSKENKDFINSTKRLLSSSVDKTVKFVKSDTGKSMLFYLGLGFLAGGLSIWLSNSNQQFDGISNDEDFDINDYSINDIEEYSKQDEVAIGTHASPIEHDVRPHGQHYNTKEGRIWKEKEGYHRGGREE